MTYHWYTDIPYPLDLQQSINLSRFATILRIRHRRGQCSDLIMQRVIGTQQSSFSDILHAHMGLHKESTAPKRTLQKTDFPPPKKKRWKIRKLKNHNT